MNTYQPTAGTAATAMPDLLGRSMGMDTPAQLRLKAKDLLPLSTRTNGPATRRALCHLGAVALAGAALWHMLGSWWAVPLTVMLGFGIAFLFMALHETAHQTAFRARAANYVLGHLAGILLVLPYEYYRAFHWDHHRYTQDCERDPELSTALPRSMAGLLWLWLGLPIWIGRLRLLFEHGMLGRVTAPWVQPAQRALIVAEARAYLALYAVAGIGSVLAGSLAVVWLWLLPLMAGQLFLRPYLLAEHTGCAENANMLENTRTTYTNALVRFFAWNMPYHAEHHSYPSVPFHALPQLNALLAANIAHTEHSYLASTRAVIRHLRARAVQTSTSTGRRLSR